VCVRTDDRKADYDSGASALSAVGAKIDEKGAHRNPSGASFVDCVQGDRGGGGEGARSAFRVFVWMVLATNGGESPGQLRRSTLAGSGGTKRQENPETKPELGWTAGVTRATVTQHQVSAADSSGMTLMGGTSISLVERHRGFSPPDPHGFMEAPDTPDLMLWCSITFQAVWFKHQRSTVDLVSRYVLQDPFVCRPGSGWLPAITTPQSRMTHLLSSNLFISGLLR